MREQRRFVLDKLVEATIERVLLDQRKIFAEQIAHGALLEPQPVQTPFAAWIDEPVETSVSRMWLQQVPSRESGRRAATRPIAAADAAAWPRAGSARHGPRRDRAAADRRGTRPIEWFVRPL